MFKNKTLKNTLWYFGGTIVTAFFGLISSPLLTRILSTEVYAQYGMVISFTAMMSTFIYLGQDEAFMRFFNNRKDSYFSFLWKCVKLPLIVCGIVLALLMEPTHTIIGFVFDQNIGNITIIIIGVYVFLLVVHRFLMLTARMEEKASNYAVSNIITKGGFLAAVISIYSMNARVCLNDTIVSLIIGVLIAMLLNSIVITKSIHKDNPDGKEVDAKEMLRFGIPFAFSSTMYLIVPLVEKIVIREKTDWTTLAIYTAAAIFITVMSMIKQTTNSIWVPFVYKEYGNENSFKKVFHDIGVSLSWFSTFILSFTVLTRRWLVMIFSSEYYDTRLIAPALMCGACFDLLSCVYAIGINIKKKTQYHILVPVIQLFVSISLLNLLLPALGIRATGIAYMFSIACSRGYQISVGLKLYGTDRNYTGLMLMMVLYLSVGILSCIFDTIAFDVLCASLMIIVATLIARKELLSIGKAIVSISDSHS